MDKSPHRFRKALAASGLFAPLPLRTSLTRADLEHYAIAWLMACEIAQHSPATRQARRSLLDEVLWFMTYSCTDTCGPQEVRQFLSYVGHGHECPGGRWGNPRMTKPVRPRTVQTYFGNLKTFFVWVIEQRGLEPVMHCRRFSGREASDCATASSSIAASSSAAGVSVSAARWDASTIVL